MPLDDADSELFKTWVIKKLENISQDGQDIADSDVLADYVLALVKTDEPEAVAKGNCIENLKDFLGDGAEIFVNNVFQAIATKAYDPSRPKAKPSTAIYQPPRRNSYEPPRVPNESRKRSYIDWDMDDSQSGRIFSYEGGDRPVKQPKRGGGGGFEPRGGRQSQQPARGFGAPQSALFAPQQMQLPPMPTPPPGMPPFDPNNPLAAFMAMQQVMGFLPPMPSASSPNAANSYGTPKTGQRCRDYDNKGYCTRGAACPYEHGENPYVVPHQSDEYDPSTALGVAPSRVGRIDASPGYRSSRGGAGRGRGGGATHRGGRQRADFSQVGTNKDKSVTSIVVEQIPEDNFDEQTVQDFFSDFGNIVKITLQPHRRLAIVEYDSYDSAQAAYSSPKSVFDNRFVKVYWYKPDKLLQPPNGHAATHATSGVSEDVEMKQEEPEIDLEEVARRQEEAQRRYDAAKLKIEEADRRKQEIDEQIRKMEQERKKMATLLAKKSGKAQSPAAETNGVEDEQTRALKAKLAELESEAKSLGIDPESDVPVANGFYGYPSYRGRGGYRGRYTPRGRGAYGQPAYRGSYGGGARGGRVTKSLDNRPKTISVTFAEGQYQEHEEALRQYLMFNNLDTATLAKHPGRDDAALVTFQQRFEGENFLAAAVYDGPLAASDLPKQLGKVELAWYKPGDVSSVGAVNGGYANGDAKMADPVTNEVSLANEDTPAREERDMDTYDEVDEA